jgi:hypothetical protein
MTTLEIRYRRLLSLYPRRHRELYAEEMVGVLMASADPGRDKPSLDDRMDIAASALLVWLRGSRDLLEDTAWRSAAQMFSLFGAMLLFAVGARRAILWLLSILANPAEPLWYGPENAVRPVIWALVVAAILARLHRSATLLAVGGVAVEITRIAPLYRALPSQVFHLAWVVTLGAAVAACSWWLARGPRAEWRRPPGLRPAAAAVTLIVLAGVVEVRNDWWAPPMFPVTPMLNTGYLVAVGAPAYLLVAALAGWAWWRQSGPVRRRMVVFAAPVLAMLLVATYGPDGFSGRPLAAVQWAILAALPALAFGAGTVALHRWERVAELVRRGRDAEQREVALGG